MRKLLKRRAYMRPPVADAALPCLRNRAALAKIGVSDDAMAILQAWAQDDKKSVVLRFSSVQVSQPFHSPP